MPSPKQGNIVADPHHFDADPDKDPTFHFHTDPDPTVASKYRLKTSKSAQIGSSSIHLACHLQIDRIGIQLINFMQIGIQLITLMRMRIRILPFNLKRIHADPDTKYCKELVFLLIFPKSYLRPFSVEGEAGEGVTAGPHWHLLEPVEAAVIDVHPLHQKYSSVN